MVTVITADPLHGEQREGPWRHEKANLNLAGKFIKSLPGESHAGQSDVPVGQ
jgi:hypothetical protein